MLPRLLAPALLLALAAMSLPAAAAPQMLALLATAGATPLACEDGVCKAEFSAICLQQERKVPTDGTIYEPIGDGEAMLVLDMPDGGTRRQPLAKSAAVIRTLRRYSAIEISLPAEALGGATAAAVEIGPRVTLIPTPVPGDPEPQTYADILEVTGSGRLAATWIDKSIGSTVAAVRMTSALINALGAADEAGDAGVEGHLATLRQVLADRAGPDQGEAVEQAIGAYLTCRMDDFRKYYGTVRRCLQAYHDNLAVIVNTAFWNQRKGGG